MAFYSNSAFDQPRVQYVRYETQYLLIRCVAEDTGRSRSGMLIDWFIHVAPVAILIGCLSVCACLCVGAGRGDGKIYSHTIAASQQRDDTILELSRGALSYRAVLRSAMSQEDKLRIKLNPNFHKDAAAMQELSKETGFSVDNVSARSCLARLALPRDGLERRRVGSISTPGCCPLVMCLSRVGGGCNLGHAECCLRCVHVLLHDVLLVVLGADPRRGGHLSQAPA